MIKKFDQLIDDFSKWAIVICLFLMLTLSLSNIVFRWFGMSFHWIDPLVRHLVFLAAFLGGSLATGLNQNIKIDLFSRYLESKNSLKLNYYVSQLVTIFSLVVVMAMGKASWGFVRDELTYGKEAFLGIHTGVLVGIIPIGFLLISLRLVNRLCINLKDGHELEERED